MSALCWITDIVFNFIPNNMWKPLTRTHSVTEVQDMFVFLRKSFESSPHTEREREREREREGGVCTPQFCREENVGF